MTIFADGHTAADSNAVDGLPKRDRCLVMGVVNVTPDSFSDGGRYLDTQRAVDRGFALVAAGADMVDVGGESTRPGAIPVPPELELVRVVPVVRELAAAGVCVSIDTMHADVAESALEVGARAVNDVSGGLADPGMARCIAEAGVPYVVTHWRGPSRHMQERAHYVDVVGEVRAALADRLEALVEAGVDASQLILDPGLGFGKTAAHNWALLAELGVLQSLGRPIMVGASRKAFLGALLADADGEQAPISDRDDATAAVSALAAVAGAYCVRVHDVVASRSAVLVAAAWRAARAARSSV